VQWHVDLPSASWIFCKNPPHKHSDDLAAPSREDDGGACWKDKSTPSAPLYVAARRFVAAAGFAAVSHPRGRWCSKSSRLRHFPPRIPEILNHQLPSHLQCCGVTTERRRPHGIWYKQLRHGRERDAAASEQKGWRGQRGRSAQILLLPGKISKGRHTRAVCASRRPPTPWCKPAGHTKLKAAGCGMPRRPCRDLPSAVA
jgi:hypothetical protein